MAKYKNYKDFDEDIKHEFIWSEINPDKIKDALVGGAPYTFSTIEQAINDSHQGDELASIRECAIEAIKIYANSIGVYASRIFDVDQMNGFIDEMNNRVGQCRGNIIKMCSTNDNLGKKLCKAIDNQMESVDALYTKEKNIPFTVDGFERRREILTERMKDTYDESKSSAERKNDVSNNKKYGNPPNAKDDIAKLQKSNDHLIDYVKKVLRERIKPNLAPEIEDELISKMMDVAREQAAGKFFSSFRKDDPFINDPEKCKSFNHAAICHMGEASINAESNSPAKKELLKYLKGDARNEGLENKGQEFLRKVQAVPKAFNDTNNTFDHVYGNISDLIKEYEKYGQLTKLEVDKVKDMLVTFSAPPVPPTGRPLSESFGLAGPRANRFNTDLTYAVRDCRSFNILDQQIDDGIYKDKDDNPIDVGTLLGVGEEQSRLIENLGVNTIHMTMIDLAADKDEKYSKHKANEISKLIDVTGKGNIYDDAQKEYLETHGITSHENIAKKPEPPQGVKKDKTPKTKFPARGEQKAYKQAKEAVAVWFKGIQSDGYTRASLAVYFKIKAEAEKKQEEEQEKPQPFTEPKNFNENMINAGNTLGGKIHKTKMNALNLRLIKAELNIQKKEAQVRMASAATDAEKLKIKNEISGLDGSINATIKMMRGYIDLNIKLSADWDEIGQTVDHNGPDIDNAWHSNPAKVRAYEESIREIKEHTKCKYDIARVKDIYNDINETNGFDASNVTNNVVDMLERHKNLDNPQSKDYFREVFGIHAPETDDACKELVNLVDAHGVDIKNGDTTFIKQLSDNMIRPKWNEAEQQMKRHLETQNTNI